MIHRILLILSFFALTACAVQEEPVEEPMVMEEIAREGDLDCDFGDDDGIGGTGCEPVARNSSLP